jgi:23S rRNA (cytosine1962-C5)-methyltransferase
VESCFSTWTQAQKKALWAAMRSLLPLAAIWEKQRPKEARVLANTRLPELAPPVPAWGSCAEAFVAQEEGLLFEIRPGNGLSVGLYVDARRARRFVRKHSARKRVLNLFAYTCGFGVAARAGGALEVLNVDASRHCLEWGRRNVEHNGFCPMPEEFWAAEVFFALQSLAKKGRCFEMVILDPPSFSNVDKRRFRVVDDYARLVEMCTQVLAPQGLLLAMCNTKSVGPQQFSGWIAEGFRQEGHCEERLGADADCRQPSWLKAEVWRKLC